MELVSITKKIHNGVQAVLAGKGFPELETEIDRLRVRQSELKDILAVRESHKQGVAAEDIEKLLNYYIENWDDAHKKEIINGLIPKIYAHADGTFTVNMGVHLIGCGGRKDVVCTTLVFVPKKVQMLNS